MNVDILIFSYLRLLDQLFKYIVLQSPYESPIFNSDVIFLSNPLFWKHSFLNFAICKWWQKQKQLMMMMMMMMVVVEHKQFQLKLKQKGLQAILFTFYLLVIWFFDGVLGFISMNAHGKFCFFPTKSIIPLYIILHSIDY